MFSKVANRDEEIDLINFAIREGRSNKELIDSLKEFKVELKSNGEIHKGKEKERIALIKRLEKENKQLKKFIMDKKRQSKLDRFDYHRYQIRGAISANRKHLKTNENITE